MQKLSLQGIIDISYKGYILEISGILLSQIQIGNRLIIKYWTPVEGGNYSDDIEDWYSYLGRKNGIPPEKYKSEFLAEKQRIGEMFKKRVDKKKITKAEIKKESYLDKIRNNAKQN